MTNSSLLHLVIPGLLGPMPTLASAAAGLDLPGLSRLLSRSDQLSDRGRDYASILFALFGHSRKPAQDLPEGAVNFHGEAGAEASEFCWMRADPVHLRPDRDRLLLFNASGLEISQAEAEEVARRFNGHFEADGLRLLTPHAQRWYLCMDSCPALRTHSIDEVSGRDLDQYMPQGPDAREWRRLSNEMQMLLYHAPFNQQRVEEGRPAINGIWLSGVGPLPESTAVRFDGVYGSDPTLLGLARLQGIECLAPPEEWGRLWERPGSRLMAVTDLLPLVWNADAEGWIEALTLVETRIAGLLAWMRSHRTRLVIHAGEGRAFSSTPGALRRFWRRNHGLSGFLCK